MEKGSQRSRVRVSVGGGAGGARRARRRAGPPRPPWRPRCWASAGAAPAPPPSRSPSPPWASGPASTAGSCPTSAPSSTPPSSTLPAAWLPSPSSLSSATTRQPSTSLLASRLCCCRSTRTQRSVRLARQHLLQISGEDFSRWGPDSGLLVSNSPLLKLHGRRTRHSCPTEFPVLPGARDPWNGACGTFVSPLDERI